MEKLRETLETSKIMSFKLDNDIHIWPLVRYFILVNFQKESLAMKKESGKKISLKIRVINLIKNIKGIKIKQRKIMFLTSTLFNIEKNGKFINVLDDYYAFEYPEESFIYEYLNPNDFTTVKNRINKNTSTLAVYMDILVILLSKFLKNGTNKNIVNFIAHLKMVGLNEELLNQVSNRLYKYNKELKFRRIIYKLFLKITKPKLIVINCAMYGEKNAILIKEAKKMGIKVAEIQHGLINKKHIAYNFSRDLKEYGIYMPDYLLVFGDYFLDINNSAVKVKMGHPHLENKKKSLKEKCKMVKNSYLFISQWTVINEMLELAIDLSKLDKGCKINFRLHPLDILTDEQQNKLEKENIIVTKSANAKDLYDEFMCYEKVVGCYSTSLIEASAFDKIIYRLDHKLARELEFDEVGIVIKNAKDILNKDINKIKKKEFYINDFSKNYKLFIESLDI